MLLHRLKKSEECLVAAEKALEICPEEESLHRNVLLIYKATSLQEMGQYEQALAVVEEVLLSDAKHPLALICKTRCLISECRYQDALATITDYFSTGRKGNFNDVSMLFLRVDVLLEQGKAGDAIKAFLLAGKHYHKVVDSGKLSPLELQELKGLDFRIRLKLNAHCYLDPREFPK